MDLKERLEELYLLTRYLGQPNKDYVIMGEGNTSARISKNEFLVKASGKSMATIEKEDFVALRINDVLKMMEYDSLSDEAITNIYLSARMDNKNDKRPSLETILHALALSRCNAEFIGHTHPVPVQILLCSRDADKYLKGCIFTEEVTFCGIKPVIIPYSDPGFEVAKNFDKSLKEYIEIYNRTPKVILIKNHGLIAIGNSAQDVKNITDMYVKVARVLVGTAALGGPVFMSEEAINRIDTRSDEQIRLSELGST